MTKADIVARMAAAAGWPKAGTERALRAALIGIRASLKRGDPVTLVGFGTFSVARRKPRMLKNPRTGQAVTVAGRIPRFKPSKELKQAVRCLGFPCRSLQAIARIERSASRPYARRRGGVMCRPGSLRRERPVRAARCRRTPAGAHGRSRPPARPGRQDTLRQESGRGAGA